MSQREEAEEGVHPSETPLCGQHDSQTEAQSPEQQRPDSPELSMSVERSWLTHSPGLNPICNIPDNDSEDSCASDVSIKSDWSKDDTIDFKESWSPLKVLLESPRSSESSRVSIKSDGSQGHIEKKKLKMFPRRSLRHVKASSDHQTSISEESTSNVSIKSDWSKDNTINFKEGRSPLKVPLESLHGSIQSNRSHGCKEHLKENHSSPKRKLKMFPRRSLRHVKASSDRQTSISEESPTSSVSIKSDWSKDDTINFKEIRYPLRKRDKTSLPTRPTRPYFV